MGLFVKSVIRFIHASLADTRLVTTPTFLTALVRSTHLTPVDAEDLLSKMSDARSWETNTYVAQATATIQREMQ